MTVDDAEPAGAGPDAALDSPEPTTQDVEAPSPGTADDSAKAAAGRLIDRARTNWRPILLVALVIAAIGLVIGLFVFQYRPDREIDDQAADRAIRAASDGAVAVLSYSSVNLDRDFADAKTHLTGNFLDYYTKFTRDYVAPTVRDKNLTQSAAVIRAGVIELHARSAVVLVFLNETTSIASADKIPGADKKDGLKTPTSIRVTLDKIDDAWLISQLDPVG